MSSAAHGASGLRSKLDVFRVLRAQGLVESVLGELCEAARSQKTVSLLPLRRSMQEFVRLRESTRLLQLAVLSLEPRSVVLAGRLMRIGLMAALMAKRLPLTIGECRDIGVAAAVAGIGRSRSDDLAFADVETCVTSNVFLEGVRWLASASLLSAASVLRMIVAIEQASAQTRRSGHPVSRMVAAVDRYDLFCQPQPHGKGLRGDAAIVQMQEAPDLDPAALRLLVHTVGRYPIGCPVKLSSGETAVVVDVPLDPSCLDTPQVILAGNGRERRVLNLAESGGPRIERSLDRNQLNVDLNQFLFA